MEHKLPHKLSKFENYFNVKQMCLIVITLLCFNLSKAQNNNVDGGVISTEDNTSICIDGTPDPIDVTLTGASGRESQWIITDSHNNILALPDAPPFDLNGAGVGVCRIWHLSYNGVPPFKKIKNLNELRGKFDLSNFIEVTRTSAEGGKIEGGPFMFTVGDGIADMIPNGAITLDGNIGQNSQWVVTDSAGNILGLPSTPYDVDFDGAGEGTCLVWHLSYSNGLQGAEVGNNVADLIGCFDLSNSLQVVRTAVVVEDTDGGTLEGGPFTFCVGNGEADMISNGAITLTGNTGANSQWVVTDSNGNILGLPASPYDVDFDGAGAGTCLVWHLSYADGLQGLNMGSNVSGLAGDYDFSNSIAVTRNQPDGGTLSGGPFAFTVGDGLADMLPAGSLSLTGSVGTSRRYVITTDTGVIKAIPTNIYQYNFETLGAGTFLITNVSFIGSITGYRIGGTIATVMGCFNLSNSITVTNTVAGQEPIEGGTISGGPFTFCVGNGTADMISNGAITLTDNTGANSQWVVTDSNGNILGLPASPYDVDFDGAGAGTCLVWHLSYANGLQGLNVGSNISGLVGDFDFSNSLSVTRNQPEGGTLTGGPYTFTVGDGVPDMLPAGSLTLTGTVGSNRRYVITDPNGVILAFPFNIYDFDFSTLRAGTAFITNVSFYGTITGYRVGGTSSTVRGCFDLSNSIEVTLNSVAEGKYSIFPNPATTQLNIDLSNGNSSTTIVRIYNAQNVEMFNSKINNNSANRGNITMDVSGYPAGLYFISLTPENGNTQIKKVIIK